MMMQGLARIDLTDLSNDIRLNRMLRRLSEAAIAEAQR